MSTVHVHVGQCGNQIGIEFWLKAFTVANYDENAKRVFHTPGGLGQNEGHIRAVFADSEKKVLQRIVKHGKVKKNGTRDLNLGCGNIVGCAKGCGSNWSLGYNQLSTESISREWYTNLYSYSHDFEYGCEDSMLKATMEAIRQEVEECDCFSGFVFWHSLAGGTGSGFGSRLCAELKERYPVAYQLNVAVSPLMSGESPMQTYNELLSLACLQQDSDAIVMFENDEILDLVESSKAVASYDAMNSYIAECMLHLFSPVSSLSPPNGPTVGIEPWELIRSTTPMHNLKFLHCRTVSETRSKHSTFSTPHIWDGLNNRLCQQLRSRFLKMKSIDGYDDSAIAAVCVCRNSSPPSKRERCPSIDVPKIATKLKNVQNCVKWNPFPIDVWVDESSSSKNGRFKYPTKSITSCSNLTSFGAKHCANLLKSARMKFDAKAYLHWYERYGTTEEDFKDAFEVVESIVENYALAV